MLWNYSLIPQIITTIEALEIIATTSREDGVLDEQLGEKMRTRTGYWRSHTHFATQATQSAQIDTQRDLQTNR